MKLMIFIFTLLIALPLVAQKTKANEPQEYQVWTSENGYKYVYISGLQKPLLQKFTIEYIRDPQWGNVKTIDKIVDHDLEKWASEWHESENVERILPPLYRMGLLEY